MDDDDDAKPLPRWLFIPTGALGILVTYLLNKISFFAMAEAAGFSTAILTAAAVAMWPLRREVSTQIFAAVAVLATITGLIFIPWPEHHQFEKSDAIYVWLYSLSLVGGGLLVDRLTRLLRRGRAVRRWWPRGGVVEHAEKNIRNAATFLARFAFACMPQRLQFRGGSDTGQHSVEARIPLTFTAI
ncbi:hypothetical protein ACFOKI_01550 [Sphingomonas qilianensis]|uniref:Uncharacterized protein n=1 Tax=Sphingomonas qilianensis TaxID=1736690 RepID=A0ABU9XTZ5_9SPHN